MVVHVLLIDGFLAPRLIFPLGASRPIGNIRTHRVRVEAIFRGLPCRHSLTPCVSPSRAPVLSFTCYFQAPATQAIQKKESEVWQRVVPNKTIVTLVTQDLPSSFLYRLVAFNFHQYPSEPVAGQSSVCCE